MSITEAQKYLLGHGIKPSAQRLAIVSYLADHRIHPTVEDIYSALSVSMPTLSRTTIYNTLKLFAEQGAVQTLVIDEKNVRYDIDTSAHAHFQCLKCNRVYDIWLNQPLAVPENQGHLMILETHLYYKGYCERCKSPEVK